MYDISRRFYVRGSAELGQRCCKPKGAQRQRSGGDDGHVLLESAATLAPRHTVFGRAERQENDELFGHGDEEEGEDGHHAGEVFDVGKLTLGYTYDALLGETWKAGIGALGSVALIPSELEHEYGDTPVSWMVFLRARM